MSPESPHLSPDRPTTSGDSPRIGEKRKRPLERNSSTKLALLRDDSISFTPHAPTSPLIASQIAPSPGRASLVLEHSTVLLEHAELSAPSRAKLIANVYSMLAARQMRAPDRPATTLLHHALPLIEHEDLSSELELKLVHQALLAGAGTLQTNDARQFAERSVNLLCSVEMPSTDRLAHAHDLMTALKAQAFRLSPKHGNHFVDVIVGILLEDAVPPREAQRMVNDLLHARAGYALQLSREQDQSLLNVAVSLVAHPNVETATRFEMAEKVLNSDNWQRKSRVTDAHGFIEGIMRLLSDTHLTVKKKQALTESALLAILEHRIMPLATHQSSFTSAILEIVKMCDRQHLCSAKTCELLYEALAEQDLHATPSERLTFSAIANRQLITPGLAVSSRLQLTIHLFDALRKNHFLLPDDETTRFINHCLELADGEHASTFEQMQFTNSLIDEVSAGTIELTEQQQRKLVHIGLSYVENPRIPESVQQLISNTILYAQAADKLNIDAHDYQRFEHCKLGTHKTLPDSPIDPLAICA